MKKYKHSLGYVLISQPGHPFANTKGQVPEHRLVVERALGIIIDPKVFNVHHVDENKANNKLSNLKLLTVADHQRVHHGWALLNKKWYKFCNGCGRILEVTKDNFYLRKTGKPHWICIPCTKDKAEKSGNKVTGKSICKYCKKLFFQKGYQNKNHCSRSCSAFDQWKRGEFRKKGGD